MNPKTSLSNAQITRIFRHHRLTENPKIERITIGFTNEVHRVDGYIFKLYLRKEGKDNYRREANLYKQLEGRALTPKLILTDGSGKLVDKPYIIYQAIEGEVLGSKWHKLSDGQRREIIKALCQQIRIIASLDAKPELGRSWQSHVKAGIGERVSAAENNGILTDEEIAQVKIFVTQNLPLLKKEIMGFIYWDVHLDNLIIGQGKLVGIVDFEHVDVVSLDYLLSNVRRMVRYPEVNLGEEMERYVDKKDYAHLMEWFEEFYPELFDFPHLEKRLQLYELDEVLRLLPRFPNAKHLKERLANILRPEL